MFYVCIASNENPPRLMYEEHYTQQSDRDRRADLLKYECYNHDGATWGLFVNDSEPFEAAHARSTAPAIEGETPEDRQTRLDGLALKAGKTSKSVLTEPEVDDIAEWYKQGYSSQADMDFQTGKITQAQYTALMFPQLKGEK